MGNEPPHQSAVGYMERNGAPFDFTQDRHRSRLMRFKPHIRVPDPAGGSAVQLATLPICRISKRPTGLKTGSVVRSSPP
jgi:hypothetical protein